MQSNFFSRVTQLTTKGAKASRNKETSQPAPNSMISKVPQLTCFNQTVIEDLNDFNDFSASGIAVAPSTTTNQHNLDISPRPIKFNLKIKSSNATGGYFAQKKNSNSNIKNISTKINLNHTTMGQNQTRVTNMALQNSHMATHDTTYMIGSN